MLDELRIRGLGVIDEAVLPLGPGFTVVTGETGAGKTMVVTGLLLLFGGRADPARVRTGTEQASVDGRVLVHPDSAALARVREAGGTVDPAESSDGTASSELVLRRVVSASGRSRAYAGGAGVPAAVLGELSEYLLAVHGQSDQLRLTRPGAQRTTLDRFAGVDLSACADAFAAWRAADAELADRTTRSAELRRESDSLRRGLDEIGAVDPQPGEAEALTALGARLGQADSLTVAARSAHDALLGDADDPVGDSPDVVGLLAGAARALAGAPAADAELDELAARLRELTALATDLGADLAAFVGGLDADPARLEQIEVRRAALGVLVRKYCDEPEPSIAGVLRWAESARERLERLDVSDDALTRLRARRDRAAAELSEVAAEVSARRRAAAAQLTAAVTDELAGLAMPEARLEVHVAPRTAASAASTVTVDGRPAGVGPDGADEVEFLLTAHRGAPALPVGRGASGGELSRVMLALEVCLAGTDPVPTLVFDEVDAGVGGRAAIEVGRRLARLARERQVLVVTHLPQVAAFADRHIVVDKPTSGPPGTSGPGAVIASDVRLVDGEERVVELARMLAGSDTSTAREHATELLAAAAGAAR